MRKSNYEFEILVNGHAVREYSHKERTYIEGRKGQNYVIKIRNNGSRRILAIPTVDGLSVLDGKTADYSSPGYIVDGYSSLTVKGWRRSDDEVAEFFFSTNDDSYSASMGKGGNQGVIGVAVFREKEKDPIVKYTIIDHHHCNIYGCPHCWPIHWYHTSSGTSSGSVNLTATNTSNTFQMKSEEAALSKQMKDFDGAAAASQVKQDLGTGWGDTLRDRVQRVEFEKEKVPDAVFEIYYNTREQLQALGVDFDTQIKYITPSAFPGGYCEPPK